MREMKQVRINKQNEYQLAQAVKGTLVSVHKAANHAIWFGLPALRKRLGKKGAVAK